MVTAVRSSANLQDLSITHKIKYTSSGDVDQSFRASSDRSSHPHNLLYSNPEPRRETNPPVSGWGVKLFMETTCDVTFCFQNSTFFSFYLKYLLRTASDFVSIILRLFKEKQKCNCLSQRRFKFKATFELIKKIQFYESLIRILPQMNRFFVNCNVSNVFDFKKKSFLPV